MTSIDDIICLPCSNHWSFDDDIITRAECEFHLNACSGIEENNFQSKTGVSLKAWPRLTEGKIEPDFEQVNASYKIRDTVSNRKASIQLVSDKYEEILPAPAGMTSK